MAIVADGSGCHTRLFDFLGPDFPAHFLIKRTFGMNGAYSRCEYEQFTCCVIVDLAGLNSYNRGAKGMTWRPKWQIMWTTFCAD